MVIPVVTGDLDPGAVDQLIGLCVQYDRLRGHARAAGPGTGADPDGDGGAVVPAGPDGSTAPGAEQAAAADRVAEVLAMLEHQILAAVIAVVSGPGGVASFLRGNLLGKGLNGPSLPLDAGQT